ncbi:MAG: hypothetical protein H0W73_04215 [Bacteroidetes bacterium]|nr:hypothetical protein [Bacteroidota bacterium]
MRQLENLHYAIGEMAYAIACADGKIQKEERQKFHDIVKEELRNKDYDFNISDIIFQILEKDSGSIEEAYNSAIHQIRVNSNYLSPELKETFIMVIESVARAFPPVAIREIDLLKKFREEFKSINGDPIYYKNKS